MNKKLKSTVVLVIISLSLLTLGTKFWADAQWMTEDGPGFMRVTPDNMLVVQVGQRLFEMDQDAETQNILDLSQENSEIIGDFAYFSNGDLLIYRSSADPGLMDNLSSYMRRQETDTTRPFTGDGLYRCNRNAQDCYLFSDRIPAIKRVFRLSIDQVTDSVYLSDSERFVVHKFNAFGELLASYGEGFRFPNQIHFHEGRLYVANTNYHEIAVLEAATQGFGKKLDQFDAKVDDNHRWPAQINRAFDKWWVVIHDGGMANGRIKVFDDNGNPEFTLPLSETSDITGIVEYNNELLVSDVSGFRISRMDRFGSEMGLLENADLQNAFIHAQERVSFFQLVARLGLFGFIAVLVGGVVAAFKLEKTETINAIKGINDQAVPEPSTEKPQAPPGDGVYWIESGKKKYIRLVNAGFMAAALSMIGMGAYADYHFGEEIWWFGLVFVAAAPLFLLIARQWRSTVMTRIGISGELLLVEKESGVVGIGKDSKVAHHFNLLIVDGVIATIGTPKNRYFFFPEDEVKKWIDPRMARGSKINYFELAKLQWKTRNPEVYTTAYSIAYACIIFGITRFTGD